MDGIIKNPIIIGLVAGVITYAYLSWQTEQTNKKKKHRKDKEEVNLLIPLAVSIIIWFVAYAYFEYTPEPQGVVIQPPQALANPELQQFLGTSKQIPVPIAPTPSYKFTGDVLPEVADPRFNLLTTGVNVPKNLPDVWLDMF